MSYRNSEHYGYINGKLLWFAQEELANILATEVYRSCGVCAESEEDDHCTGCIANRAEETLEKQIIDEGVAFMTNLVKEWGRANRAKVAA